MTRPVRAAIVIAALAAFQAAAYLAYLAVERARAPRHAAASLASERLGGTELAPTFDATGPDGSPVVFTWPNDQVRLVHFWATWCKPCRAELPGLLALARARGLALIAVAVDDDWADIRAFFDGDVPPEVVVTRDPDLHKRFGVSTLPDSYLIDRAGALVERFHGARDWRSAAARDHLVDAMR